MIKFRLIVSGLALTTMFSACNQTENKAKVQEKDSITVAATAPPQIKDSNTAGVYTHYVHLKDALVASNTSEAQKAAKELSVALVKIDGCENTAALSTKISEASDIKAQRQHFTALSSDIIAMLKHTELTSGNMYVQYCPMANEGDGAYWLASETDIKNPYYGEEMLNCGEVKETIGTK